MGQASALAERLEALLPRGRVIRDPFVVGLYSLEASGLSGVAPAAVVTPRSTAEVSLVLREAYRLEVPLYIHGSSSGLSGSAVPLEEGIVLSMEAMRRIRGLSLVDGYVEAEAGLRLGELDSMLQEKGYMFPVDPASARVATVGGAVATGAGGLRGAAYGTMRDWVLGLEAVLPDEEGTVLQLGCRLVKCRQGYDLVRLLVGSEGTLAAVTAAVLRLAPLPEAVVYAAGFYSEPRGPAEAVAEARRRGLRLLLSEYMDARAVEVAAGHLGLPVRGEMLLLGLETRRCAAREDLRVAEELLRETGAESVYTASSPGEAEWMLRLRRSLFPAQLAYARSLYGSRARVFVEDIAVPPSRLPEAVEEIRRLAEEHGVAVATGGHVGDGNLHPAAAYLPGHPSARAAEEFFRDVMRLAVKLGGTVSAEHGIGVLKKWGLEMELRSRGSEKALELMRMIKRVFDPKGILNPGKVV